LITDGDLNFGITSKGGLKELIEEKKKSGLFLSVIGTGLWNYKDDTLEVLSKHGNGTYCVVNDLKDVEESIDRRYIALTNIIAKDVKAQVEFNPRLVKSYRLLGYENREISHEAFANDTVISEPYGSGGHGVALYELEMGGAEPSGLKYQTAVSTDSDELCTVKVRYKEPLGDVSHEIEAVVYDRETGTKNAELARLLYCVSEKLRGSDKLDEADEEFLKSMLANGKYRELCSDSPEKLILFVEAMLLNGR
jgi:Ca-activated chloride channel family protein